VSQALGGNLDSGLSRGQSMLLPLDRAVEYARENLFSLLPIYALSAAPMTLAMYYAIDVVSSQHRSAVSLVCLLLLPATLWRWVGLAFLQRRVQSDVRGTPALPVRSRLHWILLLRLYGNFMLTWGSVVFIFAPPGLLLSGLATPLLLDQPGPVGAILREGFRWTRDSAGRLLRIISVVSILSIVVLIAVVIIHLFVLEMLLPSLTGYESPEQKLTVYSAGWYLSVGYALFLLFDFYWAIASVFIFDDLQSRRTGSDLKRQLALVAAGTP
jgi:hypothetical protein